MTGAPTDIKFTTQVGFFTDGSAPYVDLEIEHRGKTIAIRMETAAIRRIGKRFIDAATEAEMFVAAETGGGSA